MVRVRLELDIDRPIEEAFDLWADMRNDLRWHAQAKRVEKTSPGPVGPGTTFGAEYQGMGPMMRKQARATLTAFKRALEQGGLRPAKDGVSGGA